MSLALVVGLVGMVTGVTSLYIAWSAQSEEAALRLNAYPTADLGDITPQGLAIRVELVNEGLRPIVVRSAQLLLDDAPVANASAWIDDAGVLEDAASEPSRLISSQRTFPISLDAREGKAVALVMDVWTPLVGASSEKAEKAARDKFKELTASLALLSPGAESRELQLQLDRAPGGIGLFPVSGVSVPTSSVDAIDAAGALLRRVPPQFWKVGLFQRGDALAGMTLRRRFAGANEIDLARLDIWNLHALFHGSFVRPVIARQRTLFPLHGLRDGEYIATFRVEDKIVAYKSFALPLNPD
jgi:hypothetical protein